jgi:hypothetical protein
MASLTPKFGSVTLTGIQDWEESGDSRVVETAITRRDGAIIDDYPVLEPKIVKVSGILGGTTGEGLRTAVNTFEKNLNLLGRQALYLFDDRYIYAVKKVFNKKYSRNGLKCFYDITFIAEDPFWLSTNLTTVGSIAITGGGATNTVSITPSGDAPAPVKFTLVASADIGSLMIYNPYSLIDRFIKFYSSTEKVLNGNRLVIDTAEKSATNAGANALSNITGDFFNLYPGVANLIQVTADAAGTLSYEYRARWY